MVSRLIHHLHNIVTAILIVLWFVIVIAWIRSYFRVDRIAWFTTPQGEEQSDSDLYTRTSESQRCWAITSNRGGLHIWYRYVYGENLVPKYSYTPPLIFEPMSSAITLHETGYYKSTQMESYYPRVDDEEPFSFGVLFGHWEPPQTDRWGFLQPGPWFDAYRNDWEQERAVKTVHRKRGLIFPYAVPMLLLLPFASFRPLNKLRHVVIVRRRRTRGLCEACGYDLRAHKPGDRCPECGTPVPAKWSSATQ